MSHFELCLPNILHRSFKCIRTLFSPPVGWRVYSPSDRTPGPYNSNGRNINYPSDQKYADNALNPNMQSPNAHSAQGSYNPYNPGPSLWQRTATRCEHLVFQFPKCHQLMASSGLVLESKMLFLHNCDFFILSQCYSVPCNKSGSCMLCLSVSTQM